MPRKQPLAARRLCLALGATALLACQAREARDTSVADTASDTATVADNTSPDGTGSTDNTVWRNPGISVDEIQKCRGAVDKTDVVQDPIWTKVLMEEINYDCSSTVSKEMLGDNLTQAEDAFVNAALKPLEVECRGCPDTSRGTSLDLKARLEAVRSPLLMSVATNYEASKFREFLEGYTYPPVGGGGLNKTHTLEVFYRPTPAEYLREKLANLRDSVGSALLTIDTKVVIVNFEAPSPPTTAAFFFHGTELMNPCMWATNLDINQVAYKEDGCEDCLVHKGFWNAFSSITDGNQPLKNIAGIWENMSGYKHDQVTRVLCGGHSLGAALATLCGPWARRTFPNAEVEVVISGSPRVFNPAAAEWYDATMAGVVTRIVNNKDIVPSLPLEFIKLHSSQAPDHSVRYQHVGEPVLLFRKGAKFPGNYTAVEQERPPWYTGSVGDHHGYVLAINQILRCNPQFPSTVGPTR